MVSDLLTRIARRTWNHKWPAYPWEAVNGPSEREKALEIELAQIAWEAVSEATDPMVGAGLKACGGMTSPATLRKVWQAMHAAGLR